MLSSLKPKGVCPLQNHPWGLCTRPKRMILWATECHWGGKGNVNLHYTSCQQKKKKFPLLNEPQNESKYKTGDQNFNLNSNGP